MDELFTTEELSTSNVNGSGGKQKLDEYKIGLINRKCGVHAQFND